MHLALSQPPTARFRYRNSYLRHFNNGLLSFNYSTHTRTDDIQNITEFSAIYLDAKSTQLLKSEHHKAVWSQCLNTLTDSPTQGSTSSLCFVRPPASRLARCPLTMTDLLDYHHVYSYVTTSKNIFVPCSNSGHTTGYNTDNKVNKLVTFFAFAPATETNS